MNISPTDASAAPFSRLSAEVTERMQGGNTVPTGNGSVDLKKVGEFHKTVDILKKPPASLKPTNVDTQKTEEAVPKSTVDVKKAPTQTDTEDKPDVKKKRVRKKWKKPKDKPNRPLSAYNLFFQAERAVMLGNDAPTQDKTRKRIHRKTHGKVGFAEMARMIGQKWKALPDEEKKPFEEQAGKEKKRYATELETWKEQQKLKAKLEKNASTEGQDDRQESASSLAQRLDPTVGTESLRLQMMTDGVNRRNVSLFQQRGQDMQTLDYIRALQDRQAERAAILGRSSAGMDSNLYQYPSAAEASANAILQQFQTMGPIRGANQQYQGLQQSAQLGYPNNMMATEFHQQMGNMGNPQRQPQFDSAREFERLQQLRGLQQQMGDMQGSPALQQNSGTQYGGNTGDLARFQQLSQYSEDMAAAMRRLQNRYNR